MKEVDKEEFLKLYKTLPPNLRDALFAEETGNNIEKICRRNQLEDSFPDILNLTGQVLLGLLPIEDFDKVLIRDVELSISKAKEISREISRFVFFPIKEDLAQLYGGISTMKLEKEAQEVPDTNKDAYREPLE